MDLEILLEGLVFDCEYVFFVAVNVLLRSFFNERRVFNNNCKDVCFISMLLCCKFLFRVIFVRFWGSRCCKLFWIKELFVVGIGRFCNVMEVKGGGVFEICMRLVIRDIIVNLYMVEV